MPTDPKTIQAMDDLLCCYDFALRGERAEGDVLRLQSVLAPVLRGLDREGRDETFAAFRDRTTQEGWDEEGIFDFLDWLAEELGLDQDLERF